VEDWTALPEYVAARREWMERDHAAHPVLDRYLYRVALRRIAADPGRWLILVGERVARFMLPARHGLVAAGHARTGTFPPWYVALTVVNVALFAGTALLAVRALRRGDLALLAGPLIVFGHQAVYAATYTSPRYAVTVGPVLVGAAALALALPPSSSTDR
jgi:hypothetical protein